MSEFQVITTPEDLEALARKDADAVVLAGFAGVPRPACTLLNQELTHFVRIDCSMPGVRRETAGVF